MANQPLVLLKEFAEKQGALEVTYPSAWQTDDNVWHSICKAEDKVQKTILAEAEGEADTKKAARAAAASAVLLQLQQRTLTPSTAQPQHTAPQLLPPTVLRRSYKNALQECLARGNHGLQIIYSEQEVPKVGPSSATDQLVWNATVRLVDSKDGGVKLSAQGMGPRKSTAQNAAAAALMALPQFTTILADCNVVYPQYLLKDITAAAEHTQAPAARAAAASVEPVAPFISPSLPAAAADPPAAAPVSAALPPSPTAADVAAPISAALIPLAPAGQEPPALALAAEAAAAAAGVADPASCGPTANRAAASAAKQVQSQLSAPALSPSASLSPTAAAAAAAAATSGSGPILFTTSISQALLHSARAAASHEPAVSSPKNYVQELFQLLPTFFQLPIYETVNRGPDTTPLFTSTVTVRYGLEGQQLSVTGPPAVSKKKAEQAAAATLIATPAVQNLINVLKPGLSLALPAFDPQQQKQQQKQQQLESSTPMAQLNELVAQAVWCMEVVDPVPVGGACHKPVFEADIIINGHLMAVGQGHSKSQASQAAAQAVLDCMKPDQTCCTAAGAVASSFVASEIQQASLEKFKQLAQQAVASLCVSGATVSKTALCAFLVQHGSNKPEVVALGTGTGIYSGSLESLAEPADRRGTVLIDCHAEVIARRSLLRWLYMQALIALLPWQQTAEAAATAAAAQYAASLSVLEVVTASTADEGAGGAGNPHGIRFRLKPGVKIHMYLSKPPCGDACDFSRPPATSARTSSSLHFSFAKPRQRLPVDASASNQNSSLLLLPSEAAMSSHWPQSSPLLNPAAVSGCRGLLRGKAPAAENCTPLPKVLLPAAAAAASGSSSAAAGAGGSGARQAGEASSVSGQGNPIRKVCCSDKIAAWNALGLQGCLLGQLLEPVYLNSITVGGPAADFCEGALCRAVCCRLAPQFLGQDGSGSRSSSISNASNTEGQGGSPSGGQQQQEQEQQEHEQQQQEHEQEQQEGAPSAKVLYARLMPDQHLAKRHHTMEHNSLQLLPAAPRMSAAVARGLKLPPPFKVNHPQIMHAPPSTAGNSSSIIGASSSLVPITGGHSNSSSAESLNWNAAELGQLEVVGAGTGTLLQVVPLQPASTPVKLSSSTSANTSTSQSRSRLSKASMFKQYVQLQQGAALAARFMQSGSAPRSSASTRQQGQHDEAAESYASAKARNRAFFEAKSLVHQHFRENMGQAWLRCSTTVPQMEDFYLQ